MTIGIADAMYNLAYYYAQLPRIEPDGTSACPFAEEIFFHKEVAQRAVEAALRDVEEQLTEERCALERASEDRAGYYRTCIRISENSVAEAKKALRNAARKRFPRDPKGPWGESVAEARLPTKVHYCPDRFMRCLMNGE